MTDLRLAGQTTIRLEGHPDLPPTTIPNTGVMPGMRMLTSASRFDEPPAANVWDYSHTDADGILVLVWQKVVVIGNDQEGTQP